MAGVNGSVGMSDRRRDLLLIALPLSVLAVIISTALAVAVYLELSHHTDTNRRLINDTAELAERVEAVQEGREEALHASQQAQLDDCYQRNSQGPSLRRLLMAIRPALGDDQEAIAIIDSYMEQIFETTPTRRDCNELADKLGLPRQPTS